MRIRGEDTGELENYLQARQEEGRFLLSYNTEQKFFDLSEIRTFDNEFDALMQAYEYSTDRNYYKIVPLAPILDAIKHLNNKFLPDTQVPDRSVLFDVGQIISDYKQELKKQAMEIENVKVEQLSPLAKTLKYKGMGKVSNDEVNQKIAEGQDIFSVGFIQEFKNASAEAVINITRSKQGMYYPDNFDVIVREEGKQDLKRNYKFNGNITVPSVVEGQKPEKINPTITFKEAFNQMQGRGVYKTFVFVDNKEPKNNRKYDAWEYIDFTKTDQYGNFKTEKFYELEIEKKIKPLSLVENVDYDNFQRLCESLKRGNVQSAKYITVDGKQEQIYLSANGRFNTVNAFDKDMNPISLQEKRQQELDALEHYKETQKQGQKSEKKQDVTEEKQSRGRKVKVS